MKKSRIIFGVFATLLLLLGCSKTDWVYRANYEYVNGISWPLSITIKAPRPDNLGTTAPEQIDFELAQGESYTLKLTSEGRFLLPLELDTGLIMQNSIIISNGEIVVECIGADNGDIYQLEKYTLVSSNKYTKNYRFVIEPEFFDNAETIKQTFKTTKS